MTIHRGQLMLFAGLFALTICGAPQPVEAGSPALKLAQSSNVMKCMEQCIRSEGKAKKASCKSHCANISSRPPKQQNCMGIYKNCNRNCPKRDKICQRGCKEALMQCS